MNVSSVKNLNGEVFSAVQDASLTNVVQTNWTQTGCSTAANGNSRRIWYTGANCKSIRPYKAVYDNVNERALLYYDNKARMTFTGVGKCNQIQKLYHHCWTNFNVTARCSGCQIAGFKDLSAAQAW